MTIMEVDEQDIAVEISKSFKDIDINLLKLESLVRTICSQFKVAKAVVNIAIVGDVEIRKANNQFLDRDSTTDCLSFDLSENNARSSKLFDLMVNAETAIKEAKKRGHSAEAELALYITHGLLHNLGFDDSTQEQAKKMHNAEDEILQDQGFGLIYNS